MPAQTFAEVSFEQCRKPTCREWFLDEMSCVMRGQPDGGRTPKKTFSDQRVPC